MNWPKRMVSQPLMAGDHQLTVAVLALQVDRQAEVACARGDRVRLAVHLGEVAVHVRELLDRLHDRVAEQVGERDLAAAGALEVVVDDDRGCRSSAWPGWRARWSRSAPPATRTCSSRRRRPRRAAPAPRRRRRAPGRRAAFGLARRLLGCGVFAGSGALAGAAATLLPAAAFGAGAGAGSGGAVGAGGAGAGAGCPLPVVVVALRWLARGSSRPRTHANSGRPTRDPRGTCDTSPRPTTRSVRMVKVNCSRQLLASIPSLQASGLSRRSPPIFPRSAVTRVSAA